MRQRPYRKSSSPSQPHRPPPRQPPHPPPLPALLTERPSATVPPDFSPFQSQLDALQLAMARSTRIDHLSNVTISSPTFTNLTTGSVSEGSNLYYTDSRVGSYISASTTIPP